VRQGLVLTLNGLPPKPKDPADRLVKWVVIAQAPGFVYQGRHFDVDGSWIEDRVAEYRKLAKGDYTAPMLREHDRDGERHGDVLALRRHSIDGVDSLIAAVAFADPEAEDKLKRGQIKYVSPSFGPIEDDRGNTYDFALREVSLVAAPHQKHLKPGDTHVLGTEGEVMPEHYDDKEKAELADEAKPEEDRLSQLEAVVGKLAGQMAEMMELKSLMEAAMMEAEAGEDEDKEDAPAPEMSEEIATLRAERDQLQAERDKAIFTQIQPQSLIWTAELAEVVFNVWRADKDRVGAILAEATPKDTEPAQRKLEPAPMNPWAVRLSEASAPIVDEDPTLSDADLNAKAVQMAEGDQIKANAIYKELKKAALARA